MLGSLGVRATRRLLLNSFLVIPILSFSLNRCHHAQVHSSGGPAGMAVRTRAKTRIRSRPLQFELTVWNPELEPV